MKKSKSDNAIPAKLVWKIFFWSVIVPFLGVSILSLVLNIAGVELTETIKTILNLIQIAVPVISIILVIIPLLFIRIFTKKK